MPNFRNFQKKEEIRCKIWYDKHETRIGNREIQSVSKFYIKEWILCVL